MNRLVIDFLASCIAKGAINETEAKALLLLLGKTIDNGIAAGTDVADLQHCHDVMLDLISYNNV